jgi:hypothetical protein
MLQISSRLLRAKAHPKNPRIRHAALQAAEAAAWIRGDDMRPGERLALLLGNIGIAAACAGAMLGLFRLATEESAALNDRRIVRVAPVDSSRLAFVPPGMLDAPEKRSEALSEAPPEAPTQDAQLRETVGPDLADRGSWSTDVEVGTAQPPSNWQTTLSPSHRLSPRLVNPRSFAARQRRHSLRTRLAELSPAASPRLAKKFEAAKAPWPPAEIALVAVKDEKGLELHARAEGSAWTLIHRYRVLAASGGAGPKLLRGDKQVPEGVYRISFLNPNSAYHVSLRVNYPNAFDRKMAAKDGRKDLGGDIMIHGKNLSAGCLAVGDEAAEELFVLAAHIGLANVRLIIAPTDFRQNGANGPWAGQPEWVPTLYTEIATAMAEFKPKPKSSGLLSFFKWGG